MTFNYEAPAIRGRGAILAETLGSSSGATHESGSFNLHVSNTLPGRAETASETAATANSGSADTNPE